MSTLTDDLQIDDLLENKSTDITSEQQQSLIDHWNNPLSLYKHTKNKLTYTTNLSRCNKLKIYMDNDDDNNSISSNIIEENSLWNYLLICIVRLLSLNNQNISYHLLAVQIYQSYPSPLCSPLCSSDQSQSQSLYLNSALISCDIGIKLCLKHLQSIHQTFYLWITTFYVLKSQILFQQRKWCDVIECIKPSLNYSLSTNIHLLYNLRASAYCELKQFKNAIKDYDCAILKTTEPSSYYNSRGTCWHELKLYSKALNDYNDAIKYNPKCVSAYNNRASLYVDTELYAKALSDANIGLKIYRNHGNLYKHRGLAHFYLRNYNNALDDLQKSIKYAPQYRPARITLKMFWNFYAKNIIKILYDNNNNKLITKDIIFILCDFIVGNNYQTNNNMVNATYADWKKEMELIEKEKEKQKNINTNTNTTDPNSDNKSNDD